VEDLSGKVRRGSESVRSSDSIGSVKEEGGAPKALGTDTVDSLCGGGKSEERSS